MFDVFYYGAKPGVLPHERHVANEAEARALCRTRCFWIIDEHTDYSGFDFAWEPKPWEIHQRHAFRSQWQKDSGTYLCPQWGWQDTHYRKEYGVTRAATQEHWVVPDGIDTTEFDFSWHPDPTDPPMIYQFGTQWQRTGGPRYVVPGATTVKYVTQHKAKTKPVAVGAVFINHGNATTAQAKQSITGVDVIKETRFFDNYLDTLKRVVKSFDTTVEYVWVCSSVCDYTDFDFSWHPSQWQAFMLHVFPSNEQQFGDTFFMHVPTFRDRADRVAILDWYDLNYLTELPVKRFEPAVLEHTASSQVPAVKTCQSTEPVLLFTNEPYPGAVPALPLWSPKHRAITPLTPSGSACLVPRSALANIQTQLWDYPFVDKTHQTTLDNPHDIVYISNGEPSAEENWAWLQECVRGKDNRIHRIDSVKGRVAAYQAAANASTTPWFFAVFAKLRVEPTFNWQWQADRLQQDKHYIFYAKNPVNGLVYGHQAMIAYHSGLCMVNEGKGLDFTLDQAHEVVPALSGTALYNTDPWTTWRTAFREVVKLKQSAETSVDYALAGRLKAWCSEGQGDNAQWSQKGALDAVEYYEQVQGEHTALHKSYEWEWLRCYFLERYDGAQ